MKKRFHQSELTDYSEPIPAQELEGLAEAMQKHEETGASWAAAVMQDFPKEDPKRKRAEHALAVLASNAYRRRDIIDQRLALTLRDASQMLNVSERTMRRYIKSGKLRAVKVGRGYRIMLADYDAFTEAFTVDR